MVGFAGFIAGLPSPWEEDYLGARPLASLVLFGTAFFLGTTAWRYQWLDKLSDKTAWQWFWVALVVMVAPLCDLPVVRKSISIAGIKGSGTAGSLIYSYWEVIKCVGTGMLSIVIFRRYFDSAGQNGRSHGKKRLCRLCASSDDLRDIHVPAFGSTIAWSDKVRSGGAIIHCLHIRSLLAFCEDTGSK
jgi:hypothetical protein